MKVICCTQPVKHPYSMTELVCHIMRYSSIKVCLLRMYVPLCTLSSQADIPRLHEVLRNVSDEQYRKYQVGVLEGGQGAR